MYYILHGEDELARTETVAKLRAKMGDPQFADLNTAYFDGRHVTLSELQHACDAVPFLTDKRLVIVENMLARFEPRRAKSEDDRGEVSADEASPMLAKDLIAYLDRLPETTRLVFVESKTLAKNNPVLKHALASDKKQAYVKEFTLPTERALPQWIHERVQAKGGTMEPGAIAELAAYIGTDLRLLDSELEKLMTYRANQTIRVEDVRTLVAPVRESEVFALVDAIGRRETRAALNLLHDQLAHHAAPIYLLAMITRQFRLLLQIKDLASRGYTRDVARERLSLHPFVANKTWSQALNFSLPQLEAIYQKLLETDVLIKTGKSEPALALEVLIIELTR